MSKKNEDIRSRLQKIIEQKTDENSILEKLLERLAKPDGYKKDNEPDQIVEGNEEDDKQ